MFCISCPQLYNTHSGLVDMRSSPLKKKQAARYTAACLMGNFKLFPQIVVGTFTLRPLLRAIFIEHTLENHHISGRHLDDFKADVIRIGVYMVRVTPLAARDKRHGILIRDV